METHARAVELLENQLVHLRRQIAESNEQIEMFMQGVNGHRDKIHEKEKEIKLVERSINALIELEVLGQPSDH